ncbi:hypothetical protein Q8W71_05490 [Methylobacterium sp. NEAU 140]|uniref:hypothetical protein n=1 Tax=Methylobacterium sp. NEAU 140 TaxID=3064945 RepID=UPI002732FF00|nr:hypothetical protein [Methylobacterium sp. NEAU 140]MDP4022066.1 hypothetical protein [Methylobacterium sp. NEAU 140]
MPALFDLGQARADELRKWQAVFEFDGNKAAAWRCYRLARAWGLPIPESVLIEIDRIAAAIGADAGMSSARVGLIVTEAHRGSADPTTSLLKWERDFEVSWAVYYLRSSGLTEAAAVERVAEGTCDLAYGVRVGEDTVSFGPVPTPKLEVDLVRRAVRRIRALTTDMTERADLMSMTGDEGIVRE